MMQCYKANPAIKKQNFVTLLPEPVSADKGSILMHKVSNGYVSILDEYLGQIH